MDLQLWSRPGPESWSRLIPEFDPFLECNCKTLDKFKKKDVTVKSEEEHFEIFNLQKRKRQRSTSPKLPFGTSPKDFFEGKIPRVRAESISSATTEDSLKSSNLFASTKVRRPE